MSYLYIAKIFCHTRTYMYVSCVTSPADTEVCGELASHHPRSKGSVSNAALVSLLHYLF